MTHKESFLKYMRFERNSSEHTLEAYERDLDQFEQFMLESVEDFVLIEATTKQIRSWVVFLVSSDYEPRSVRRKVSSLKSFYRYMRKLQVIERAPTDRVPLPKVGKRLPRFVDVDAMNHLLADDYFPKDFEGVRDFVAVSMLYDAGMRVSELVGLKDSDVRQAENVVRVLGKRRKVRNIPYPPVLNAAIDVYLAAREEKFGENVPSFLLSNSGKQTYRKLIYNIVNKYLSLVTTLEQKSPHVLRHSYATHMMNNGADLNDVKELLGHSSLAATQIYTHTTTEQLQKLYKQAHPRG
ncbi:MAG: tyrosine-type recombinase/integrase [Mangrovibacterium sp.]